MVQQIRQSITVAIALVLQKNHYSNILSRSNIALSDSNHQPTLQRAVLIGLGGWVGQQEGRRACEEVQVSVKGVWPRYTVYV